MTLILTTLGQLFEEEIKFFNDKKQHIVTHFDEWMNG